MNWGEYQEEVSSFFKSIGAVTKIDALVRGVRGNHKVDVLVKLKHFGIDVTWIIECKLWKTPVPKEKILTLQQIVQDVGADRGVLMSESGFQAGAIRSAGSSNITLSSLAELREIATEELLQIKLRFISFKLEELTRRYHTFVPWKTFSHIRPFHLIDNLLPNLFSIRTELFKAQNDNFPINLFSITTKNIQEFIDACETVFSETEREIFIVEGQYNHNIKKGKVLFEDLKKLVLILFDIAKKIIQYRSNESKQDQARIQAVGIMKKIGGLTLEIRGYTTNRSFPYFTMINKILIDQLYLDLVNEELQEKDLYKTLNNMTEAYSKFEKVFQPINNPPAPNTPA